MKTHTLTTEELKALVEACHGSLDEEYPLSTNNSLVNWAVDCLMARELGEEEPEFDKMYITEAIEYETISGN